MKQIDFAQSLNCSGLPEGTEAILRESAILVTSYPDYSHSLLKELLEEKLGIPKEAVTFGAGTTEIIFNLPYILKKGEVLIPSPTFWQYEAANRRLDHSVINRFELKEEDDFKADYDELREKVSKSKVLYLCNPNNPTSKLYNVEFLQKLVEEFPETDFVVDETYLFFDENFDRESLMKFALSHKNLYVVMSFSKFFSMPGLRVGVLVSQPENIEKYEKHRIPYTMSPMAGTVLEHVLKDQRFILDSRTRYRDQIGEAYRLGKEQLPPDSCKLIKPEGPFMLVKLLQDATASQVEKTLADKDILIRDCTEMQGLGEKWIRVSCRNREDMSLLFTNLTDILNK